MNYFKHLLLSFFLFSCASHEVTNEQLQQSVDACLNYINSSPHINNSELAEKIRMANSGLGIELSSQLRSLKVHEEIMSVPEEKNGVLMTASSSAKSLRALIGKVKLEDLRGMAMFLAFMKNQKGGFYPVYIPSENIKYDNPEMENNSEVVLALLEMYNEDPLDIWYNFAFNSVLAHINKGSGQSKKAIERLLKKKTQRTSVKAQIPDNPHYFFLAVKSLLQTKKLSDESKVKLFDFTESACTQIMKMQVVGSYDHDYLGAFSKLGIIDKTAILVHSLISCSQILPDNHVLQNKIKKAAEYGVYFLINGQREDGSYTYAIKKVDTEMTEAKKFNNFALRKKLSYSLEVLQTLKYYKDFISGNLR